MEHPHYNVFILSKPEGSFVAHPFRPRISWGLQSRVQSTHNHERAARQDYQGTWVHFLGTVWKILTVKARWSVAKPKSPIFTWSSESKKMLTGFKSRWIIPWWKRKYNCFPTQFIVYLFPNFKGQPNDEMQMRSSPSDWSRLSGLSTVFQWLSCQWPCHHLPVYLLAVLEEVKSKWFPGGIQGPPPLGSQSLSLRHHRPCSISVWGDTHHVHSFSYSSLHTISPASKILVSSAHLNCANSTKCQLPYKAFRSDSNSTASPVHT